MTKEEHIAEEVAKRLQGLKKYGFEIKERVTYYREIWATDMEAAEEILGDDCDYGDPVSYDDYTYNGEAITNDT